MVYGPQQDEDKVEFLSELLLFREASPGPWLLCEDFNMIYQAEDKNNDRLDRRNMRRFRAFINRAQLQEIELTGRRFTWSSERERPTLERIDRFLASVDWFAAHPYHYLRPLSTDCSDHCPLLLLLDTSPGTKLRFRFESFWTKLPGFVDVVAVAWARPLPNANPFRLLDFKLRNVARAL